MECSAEPMRHPELSPTSGCDVTPHSLLPCPRNAGARAIHPSRTMDEKAPRTAVRRDQQRDRAQHRQSVPPDKEGEERWGCLCPGR